ncbi:ABC-type transport auxiliary lipoprotein family protein [Ciceribacter thiooxidans]|uniref:ABC-type transport auxiliary lipoprotein family protein n=1 Tax=Ciceribacter thiooxidans TaxID=1969821 RepID=A0ABV7I5U9_9HYPH|nr:ABC-type transport auxiliary lipoprotein family protein [Ciceribacter thiooxidans]
MGESEFDLRRRRLLWGVALLPLMGAGLAGCGTAPAKNDTFDLTVAANVETKAQAKKRQILIADPSALKALDSEQIMVRVSPSEIQYLAKSQWSDRLPRMVQSKLVEAFENTGRIGGVGKPGQGLAIDYQLVSDIRAFEIDTTGSDRAVVEISLKLVDDRNGTVRAQRVFSASAPAVGASSTSYVRALDRAFAVVTGEMVTWTLTLL